MTLRDVKEVKGLQDVDEVNTLLANGWILIDTYKQYGVTCFLVGRVGAQNL